VGGFPCSTWNMAYRCIGAIAGMNHQFEKAGFSCSQPIRVLDAAMACRRRTLTPKICSTWNTSAPQLQLAVPSTCVWRPNQPLPCTATLMSAVVFGCRDQRWQRIPPQLTNKQCAPRLFWYPPRESLTTQQANSLKGAAALDRCGRLALRSSTRARSEIGVSDPSRNVAIRSDCFHSAGKPHRQRGRAARVQGLSPSR
jgi:hypothetical protein